MDILILQTGRDSTAFARFHKKGETLRFQGADRRLHDNPDSFDEILRELASGGAAADRVLLSLDPKDLFFRELEIPIRDRRKLREILPIELKGETAIDTDALTFDAVPLSNGRIMAIWGVAEELERRIASMTVSGVEPQCVGSSLFHWHLLIPEETDGGPLGICDGRSLAVYADGEPVLFRSLGNGSLREEISRTLTLLDAGKGIRVNRVFLHGPAASVSVTSTGGGEDGISVLPLPAKAALLESFPGESTAVEHAGAWALATACLKGEPVNFRHGRLAYTAGRELLKKRLRLTAILAGVCILLILGETGVRYFFVKKDLASLDTSIKQIYQEVFPKRTKAVDALSELKSELRRLGGGAASQETLRVLNGIALAKADDITGIYEAELEGGQVRLKGEARSFQVVNDFKSRLAPLFASSEVSDVKTRPDGSVSFSIRGTLREGTR